MDPDPPLSLIILFSSFFLASISGIIGALCFVFILLIFSALISGSEVAYFSLSPQNLDDLSSEDSKSAASVLRLRKKPRHLLATILISNNFINIGIVILSDYIIKNLIGEARLISIGEVLVDYIPLGFSPEGLGEIINFLITIVGVTFILVLFGEVAPKIYANLNNMKFAKMMSRPMLFLFILFKPISNFLVKWSSKMESRLIRQNTGKDNTSTDDLDKAIMLTVSDDKQSDEADILRGIIKFGNVSAKQIMRSRVDVIAVENDAGFDDVIQLIRDSGFSRIPVYEEDFDNILGILYVKDLLGYSKEKDDFHWQQFIRDNVLYVPESKKIDDLLKEFQQKRVHMGIVVDEFGGSAGIVTLEDIMEEVIGEIKDEFDEDEEVDFIKINDHNYIFDGKTMLNDVARVLTIDKNTFDNMKGDADSLAGLLLNHYGYIPKKDKTITLNPFKFKVVSVSKRRIEKIHMTLL